MDGHRRLSVSLTALAVKRLSINLNGRTRSELPSLRQGHDRHAKAVGQRNDLTLIDYDRLAGFDRQNAGATAMQVLDGRHPDGRYVEAHILLGLGHLDECPSPGPAKRAGRSMQRSVPSMASTASVAFSLTATDWPTSSRPISLAILQPKAMSARSAAVGDGG